MRRTKIVATLGPATREPSTLRPLLEAGVDVVRLNLAHADPATHAETARSVREQSKSLDREVAILADLPGPKMRTGALPGGEISLEPGQEFVLYGTEREGGSEGVSTSVDSFARLVDPGDEIFLADGAIILRVTSIEGTDVHTTVIRRGLLRSRKGMHVPRAETKIRAFTDEDMVALKMAIELGADAVGLSFVRNADDIIRVRKALDDTPRRKHPLLVAKIETRSAVDHLEGIIQNADAVMVARGDLGIQMPFREVPLLQKEIISACNCTGTPVITATQMLESMTHGPLPSRAEVNDVANAVLDGTDALMLSEETAVGKYPVATVETMAEIAEATEHARRDPVGAIQHKQNDDPVSWAVARGAVQAAEQLKAAAILCPTRSGSTARRVAAFRPSMPILGLGHPSETVRGLGLVWGVIPKTVEAMPEERITSEAVAQGLDAARHMGLVDSGDLVAVVAGGPPPRTGSTDYMRIVLV